MPEADQPPPREIPFALPVGTLLSAFEIRSVLGSGGFGIVYRAYETSLNREVAIKEYMPRAFAVRHGPEQVAPFDDVNFDAGLKSFVNEAKLLAQFDHPSLPRVYRFWEANGTAYIAMPVLSGQTLKQYRESLPQPPDEAWLRRLLDPLLGALETLHAKEIFHRDIAPDNIVIGADGRPVLIDFGAARRLPGDKSEEVTTIYKQSYSPLEQLNDVTQARTIGPWTDIFALGGTLHFLLLNRPPKQASARASGGVYKPLAEQALPGCSAQFLGVIDQMLALQPGERPQSISQLRAALGSGAARPMAATTRPDDDPSGPGATPRARQRLARVLPIALAALLGTALAVWALNRPAPAPDAPAPGASTPDSRQNPAPVPESTGVAMPESNSKAGSEAGSQAAPETATASAATSATLPATLPASAAPVQPAAAARPGTGASQAGSKRQGQAPVAQKTVVPAPALPLPLSPAETLTPAPSAGQASTSQPGNAEAKLATPSANAACAGLGLLQKLRCMRDQCGKPGQANTADCLDWYRQADLHGPNN